MTVFDYFNVVGRLALTAMVVVKLGMFREMANVIERMGLGAVGAGSFLTVPVILYRNENPFEGWSVTLLTYGVVLFLAGRTWRDSKHARANAIMVEQGRAWKAQKGKP